MSVSRRSLLCAAALLVALALVGGAACATRRAGADPDLGLAGDGLEAPDGRWLADEQGREYFVDSIPRAQAARVGPGDVRTHWGIKLDVVREDAERYFFKVYRPVASPPGAGAAPPGERPPSAAELKAVRAQYAVRLRESRRLSLAPFGEGLPRVGQWRESFAVADMNGDGNPDIVHGPARKSLGPPAIFLGDGAGRWRRWREAAWPPLPYDYGAAAVADLDGDGAQDLVLGVHLGGVLVLAGDGRGGFRAAGDGVDFSRAGAAFSTRALTVLDADRDGRPDIVALGEGPRLGSPGSTPAPPASGLLVYRNRGGGGWERDAANTGGGRPFGAAIAAGDFDGDGLADVATGSGVVGSRELLNLAREPGRFEPRAASMLRPAAIVGSVAVADFDGDGADDLVVAGLGHEGGLWRAFVDVLLSPAGPRERRVALWSAEEAEDAGAVGAGDLDGDGAADVVVATDGGEVLLFPGDGAGGFTRERATLAPFGGGCRGTHLELADLDADGAAEVVASFALEDAGGLDGASSGRCPGGGGLGAWKAVPRRLPPALALPGVQE